eukprot:1131149-Prymnesium_polylepis.1
MKRSTNSSAWVLGAGGMRLADRALLVWPRSGTWAADAVDRGDRGALGGSIECGCSPWLAATSALDARVGRSADRALTRRQRLVLNPFPVVFEYTRIGSHASVRKPPTALKGHPMQPPPPPPRPGRGQRAGYSCEASAHG